ncbi:MAG TPA: SpoIIE family protein phosphatase [Pirellulales bacterium]|jgi:serine phosphatase RsbU (regulator of sigma subunit)|nr:SpoIIE family protein phosphatase [Pirellulales bacterium]
MAILEVFAGNNVGEQVKLAEGRSIMGRHPDCDIVLDAGAVSRQHAQITWIDGDYFVEDLHSRNGTFVNGEPIQAPRRLAEGDRLKICDLAFTFYRDQPSQRATVAATGLETVIGGAMLVEDDDSGSVGRSTIMSKIDILSDAGGVRLGVNPEMKLRALIEITQNLRKSINVDEVLPKLLDSLFKIFVQADRGFVVLRGPVEGQLLLKAVKQRRAAGDDAIRMSRTIVNEVLTNKQAILSADAATDSRFQMSQSIADFRIRSMMCAPLVSSDGNALGAIQLDTLDQRSRFQQDDLDMLAGVAGQAAFVLENAQLHEQSLKQQSIQRDLELAHKVQQGLLPAAPPKIEKYRFFDFYEPANQVGGDFYDYIRLSNGRLAIVLADVSGKGVSAALVMAKLSAEVRYCLASESSAAAAINRINYGFCHSGWDDRFVTMVMALVDPQREEATIVNAGHMPPLLRRGPHRVEPIGGDQSGVPLGVDPDHRYHASTVRLNPGDFMTLFTDGISEAMNAENQLYGINRLTEQVGANADDVAALGRQILDDVKQFVGGRPQSDDMCLLCFGRER